MTQSCVGGNYTRPRATGANFILAGAFLATAEFFTKGKTNFYLFESESFESYDPIRIGIPAHQIHLNYFSVISALHYCPKSVLR